MHSLPTYFDNWKLTACRLTLIIENRIFLFSGAARHVLFRPLGHRGRTTVRAAAPAIYFHACLTSMHINVRLLKWWFNIKIERSSSSHVPRILCGIARPRCSCSTNSTLHCVTNKKRLIIWLRFICQALSAGQGFEFKVTQIKTFQAHKTIGRYVYWLNKTIS